MWSSNLYDLSSSYILYVQSNLYENVAQKLDPNRVI